MRTLGSRSRAVQRPGPKDKPTGPSPQKPTAGNGAIRSILDLNRTAGNRAVERLLQSREAIQRQAAPEAAAEAAAAELSGAAWVDRFPTSTDTATLKEPFRANVDKFLAALRAAGASVTISATYRPPERAHLMHYAYRIAREKLSPRSAPAREGVNINWVHKDAKGNPDLAASRAAAEAMVTAYQIVYRPALRSRHTQGRAIDMTISWEGDLVIANASGENVTIKSTPRSGQNTALHAVGASYSVNKLVTDAPHWSDDGR